MPESSALDNILNHKYRLVAELGRGAMGVVYRAEQLDVEGHVQRLVALKTLRAELSTNPEFARRFLHEIRITMTLNNPHIVTVYDSGRDETGQLYFTMELVQGQTLRELLRQEGSLSVEHTLHITGQICEALAEAHSRVDPIVHRDLKPANIFLAQRQGKDWAKIGDFGIAKIVGDHTDGLTRTGMTPGTPRYMAPEQCLGHTVDSRTDLYALGIMMYEMLVGHPPFRAENEYALLRKHVEEAPPPYRPRFKSAFVPKLSSFSPRLRRIDQPMHSVSADH
jgi:serine/threonine-protein kinase